MNPTIKYTLARLGLFVVVAMALVPVPLSLFVKLMVALVASAVLSFFLLRGWRDQVAEHWAGAAQRRKDERAKLRAALAGTDSNGGQPDPPSE